MTVLDIVGSRRAARRPWRSAPQRGTLFSRPIRRTHCGGRHKDVVGMVNDWYQEPSSMTKHGYRQRFRNWTNLDHGINASCVGGPPPDFSKRKVRMIVIRWKTSVGAIATDWTGTEQSVAEGEQTLFVVVYGINSDF